MESARSGSPGNAAGMRANGPSVRLSVCEESSMTMHYGVPLQWSRGGWDFAAAQGKALARQAPGIGFVYRIEAVCYSGCSIDQNGGENYYLTAPKLELFAFPIVRWTEHGATIAYPAVPGGRDKWVDLRPDAKQWASTTVGGALEEFRKRRERQLYILKRQVGRAERELALCDGPYSWLPTGPPVTRPDAPQQPQ